MLTDIAGRLVTLSRERGLFSVLRASVGWAVGWVAGRPRAGRPSSRSFRWDGRDVPYFSHAYHYTWLNERAVETPLALEVLAEHDGADVLEVGNVLSHYHPVDHLVIDKYEVAPGVVNVDAADFETDRRFDLVLAVSTLEHVGLDEDVKDPDKAARAVGHLRSLLKPGGRLWITHPVGYNPDLDAQLRSGELGLSLRALRRDEHRNRWREVPIDEVWSAGYDRLLYTAHGVVVGEYVAPKIAVPGVN